MLIAQEHVALAHRVSKTAAEDRECGPEIALIDAQAGNDRVGVSHPREESQTHGEGGSHDPAAARAEVGAAGYFRHTVASLRLGDPDRWVRTTRSLAGKHRER